MSRGGRGGGRGGRWGRGGASVTHELIRDNLEDLGLDSYQHYEDRAPPPLYPPIEAPLPIIPAEEDVWLVYKMREMQTRMKLSPFYLTRNLEQHDISRYSDRRKKPTVTAGAAMASIVNVMTPSTSSELPSDAPTVPSVQAINASQVDRFVPQELLHHHYHTRSSGTRGAGGGRHGSRGMMGGRGGRGRGGRVTALPLLLGGRAGGHMDPRLVRGVSDGVNAQLQHLEHGEQQHHQQYHQQGATTSTAAGDQDGDGEEEEDGAGGRAAGGGGGEDEMDMEADEVEVEEDDYGVDHYASDPDEYGGGGGGAGGDADDDEGFF